MDHKSHNNANHAAAFGSYGTLMTAHDYGHLIQKLNITLNFKMYQLTWSI